MAADWGHHLLSRKKNVVGNKEPGYPEEGEKDERIHNTDGRSKKRNCNT